MSRHVPTSLWDHKLHNLCALTCLHDMTQEQTTIVLWTQQEAKSIWLIRLPEQRSDARGVPTTLVCWENTLKKKKKKTHQNRARDTNNIADTPTYPQFMLCTKIVPFLVFLSWGVRERWKSIRHWSTVQSAVRALCLRAGVGPQRSSKSDTGRGSLIGAKA